MLNTRAISVVDLFRSCQVTNRAPDGLHLFLTVCSCRFFFTSCGFFSRMQPPTGCSERNVAQVSLSCLWRLLPLAHNALSATYVELFVRHEAARRPPAANGRPRFV